MELTEGELRERGIFRSVEEVHSEAQDIVDSLLISLPVGRRSERPEREFTKQELATLREGGLALELSEYGGLVSRTAAKHAAILASSLTVREVAEMLRVSEGRIRQRISGHSLYSVMSAAGERRLPRFQFYSGGMIPGIEAVARVLPGGVHPVVVQNFFLSASPDLYLDEREENPVSPREWLISGGDPEAVARLARVLA